MAGDKQVKNKGKPHRWKKGESGNPNGRPKKNGCLTSILKKMAGQKADYILSNLPPGDYTWEELVSHALIIRAVKGDVQAIKEFFDRVAGKVPTPIEHAGKDGKELPPATFIMQMPNGTILKANGFKVIDDSSLIPKHG